MYSNGETFKMLDPVKLRDFEICVPDIPDPLQGAIYEDCGNTLMYVDNFDKPSLYSQQLAKLSTPEKYELFGAHNIEDGYFIKRDVIICTLGFAISVHKSQGSQFQNVFVDFDYCSPKWDPRRWLYTGVTRATNEVNLTKTDNLRFI